MVLVHKGTLPSNKILDQKNFKFGAGEFQILLKNFNEPNKIQYKMNFITIFYLPDLYCVGFEGRSFIVPFNIFMLAKVALYAHIIKLYYTTSR